MKKYIIYLMFILILIVGCQSEKEKGYTFKELNPHYTKPDYKYNIEDIVILKINGTKCMVIGKEMIEIVNGGSMKKVPRYYLRCKGWDTDINNSRFMEFELEPYIK